MAEANSLNAATTGIVGNTGTAFTGTAVTQYNVITGAATSSTLNNVAPSATSGVPLISQGASAQPIFGTVAIAGGGTNATTFTQSAGIVVYNGTSLVNYAGPQIDTSGRQTNTTQPAFNAYLSSDALNVTGDGTVYTVVWNATDLNVGTIFNTSTGTFTAPVTGNYMIGGIIELGGLLVAHTNVTIIVIAATHNYLVTFVNPFAFSSSNTLCISFGPILAPMAATNTATVTVQVTGGTKVVDVVGIHYNNQFYGYLVS